MKTNTKVPKTPFFAAFSVGAVLFSAHAGGGFATGNQANTYYVGLGWTGIISAIAAMLLLTLTMREAMIMYNSRGLTSYKQLFETLYHPFDKIEWAFEVFFYIMVLMAVAAAISGAASALNNYFTINYYIGVAIVGVIVLMLTIFGAGIVRAASTYMGMAILVTAISIYVIGIFKSDSSIFSVLAADFETTGFMNMPKAILNAFTYAGFQGHVEFLCDERRRPGPLRVHAHELAERLYRRGGRLHHPHPHRLQDHRHPRYGGRLRHLPAPLPHLHRRDHHLRLRGPV